MVSRQPLTNPSTSKHTTGKTHTKSWPHRHEIPKAFVVADSRLINREQGGSLASSFAKPGQALEADAQDHRVIQVAQYLDATPTFHASASAASASHSGHSTGRAAPPWQPATPSEYRLGTCRPAAIPAAPCPIQRLQRCFSASS